MVCLIKPQFEAGRDKVGKKGVVREPSVHEEVIVKVMLYADLVGFAVKGITYSPIKGPEGNIEYLIYLEKKAEISDKAAEMSEAEAENLLRSLMSERIEKTVFFQTQDLNFTAANLQAEEAGHGDKNDTAGNRDRRELAASVVSEAHSALDEAKQAK